MTTGSTPIPEWSESALNKRRWMVVAAVLVLQVLLVSPALMPSFGGINPYDEAKYIVSGDQLLHLQVRDLAWGPLVAVFYAPIDLVFGQNPDWFMLEAWAGRVVLFALLWLTTFLVGRELAPDLEPMVLAGLLFVSVPFIGVIANQSDALFASFAALALAALLRFRHSGSKRALLLGSVCVGLAMLSRAEAILLLGVYPVLAVGIGFKRPGRLSTIGASLLPALVMVALYIGAFRLSTGGFNLGMGSKAYDSFETNQSVTTGGNVSRGKAEARRLYGTADENQHSVLRAISRNPGAFAQRLVASAKTVPGLFLDFFERRLGPVTLLLAAWGIWRLVKSRQFAVLAILGVWSLEPLTSLAFLTRHLVPQLAYLGLILAAVGLGAMAKPSSRIEHGLHLAGWLGLLLFGLAASKLGLAVGGLLVLAAMLLADGLGWAGLIPDVRAGKAVLLGLFLCGGLVLRTPFPFPNYAALGQSPEEQAVHFLEASLPQGSFVMVPFPGPALAARMDEVEPADVPSSVNTSVEFEAWIQSKGVDAVYLDSRYKQPQTVYDLAQSMAQGGLKVGFTSSDGQIRVLIPTR